MPAQKTRSNHLGLLDIAGYFILPAIAVPLLIEIFTTQAPLRWFISGLMLLVAVVFSLREIIINKTVLRAHLYAAIQTTLIVLIMALPPHPLIVVILFFVLSAEVTMLFPPRAAAAWIVLFSVVTVIAYVAEQGFAGLLSFPTYVAGYIFFAVFAQQTARAETARARSESLLLELQAAHRQLQEYAQQAEELAVQQERNRLAREMHDTLGHRLTVASVQVQAAQRLITAAPARAATMLGVVYEQISEGLGDLRRTVAALRAPLEADLALDTALRRLASHFAEATGLTLHLAIADDLPTLPAALRHALYRGAQEGLTNIQKHADAQTVWLELTQQGKAITLCLNDDGRGFDAAAIGRGFGLHGLRERAAQLGGDFSVATRPEGGTELRLSLPLASEAPHA
ncbi:MAG: sensor histidine kinase [Caldilineales bacterium]